MLLYLAYSIVIWSFTLTLRIIESLWLIMTPEGGSKYMDTRAGLVGCIKINYIHCCTQNIIALGIVVSEKIVFIFSIVSLWELFVAMETRVLSQNLMQPCLILNHLPQN